MFLHKDIHNSDLLIEPSRRVCGHSICFHSEIRKIISKIVLKIVLNPSTHTQTEREREEREREREREKHTLSAALFCIIERNN